LRTLISQTPQSEKALYLSGRSKTFSPDIRFRVENIPGDHEGPELLGWRVSKE
jgi:hypothetical protein